MEIGFVLIHVATKRESEVFKKLSNIPEVIEAYPLFGDYDILAKIEVEDYDRIGEIVIHKIRTINGITFTSTLTRIKLH
jgi:DNA-binding Lrp family transcriptional regulator